MSIKSWLLSPSKIPNAPSWTVVILFGAAWNAIIERSYWATCFCLGLVVVLPLIMRAKATVDMMCDRAAGIPEDEVARRYHDTRARR